MERAVKQTPKGAPEPSRQAAQAISAPTPALDHVASKIDNSPYMVAQQKKVEGLFGNTVQLRQDEEEPLQGRFETAQRVEDEEKEMPLQGKLETVQRLSEDDEVSQQKQASESPVQREPEPAPKPNNTGLPDNLKAGVESLSGLSMDDVIVSYNSSQPASLNALAYAQGTDIHVAPGQEEHLPHEAWHVVQQAQGRVKPTMERKGIRINDDSRLESEADEMGRMAAFDDTASVTQLKQEHPSAAPLERAKKSPDAIQNQVSTGSFSANASISSFDNRPYLTRQRQTLQSLFGNRVQLQKNDEEDIVQRAKPSKAQHRGEKPVVAAYVSRQEGAQDFVQQKLCEVCELVRMRREGGAKNGAEKKWYDDVKLNGLCGGWVEIHKRNPLWIEGLWAAVASWTPPSKDNNSKDNNSKDINSKDINSKDINSEDLSHLNAHLASQVEWCKSGRGAEELVLLLKLAWQFMDQLEPDAKYGKVPDSVITTGTLKGPPVAGQKRSVKVCKTSAGRTVVQEIRSLIGDKNIHCIAHIETKEHHMSVRINRSRTKLELKVVETERAGIVSCASWEDVMGVLQGGIYIGKLKNGVYEDEKSEDDQVVSIQITTDRGKSW